MTNTIHSVSAPAAPRSSRLKLAGYVALGFCAFGYAGFVAAFLAIKGDHVSMAMGLTMAGVFGVIGEAGLWIGAACLGLGLYRNRREKIARWFRRMSGTGEATH